MSVLLVSSITGNTARDEMEVGVLIERLIGGENIAGREATPCGIALNQATSRSSREQDRSAG